MKSLVHRHVLVRKRRNDMGLQPIPPALNTEKLTNLHHPTNPFASYAVCLLGNNQVKHPAVPRTVELQLQTNRRLAR